MSIKIDDIKSFITLSRTKNITKAAQQLGMTQPTLSYAIKRIESALSCKVIIRLKSGIELTKPGEEFLKKATNLVNQWEDVINTFSEDGASARGEYSLGIHPSVAISLLSSVIKNVKKELPNINFNLVHDLSRVITSKVINFEIDMAISVNPINHPDLVITTLKTDVVTLFRTANSAPTLIYDPSLHQSQSIIKKLKETDIEIKGYIHSNNLEVIRDLCSKGLGIALLPKSVADKSKNLIAVKKAPKFNDKICFIYRKEKLTSAVNKKLISVIRNIKF